MARTVHGHDRARESAIARRLAVRSASALILAVLSACSSASPTASGTSSDGGATSVSAGSGGRAAPGGFGGSAGTIANGGSASRAGANSGGTASMSGGGSSTSNGGTGGSAGSSGSAVTAGGGGTSGGGMGSGGNSGSAGRGGNSGSAGLGGSANGGAAGSANGGAGSGGTGADCGFTPVTPNATAATRKVLCYLHSIYGNHILSGQEENNDDSGMNTIVQATGKYPAIRAFDVNNSMAPTQCVDQWNKGGLCMFGYHMGINGNNFNVAANIDNVLKSGTSENKSFNQDLDRIARGPRTCLSSTPIRAAVEGCWRRGDPSALSRGGQGL